MPSVLCGLKCFDVPSLSTAGTVAREFSSSLNPALISDGCPIEVYRLEPLKAEAQLSVDDKVACFVPGWQFDFPALEDLHRQHEELRADFENLNVQYSRTQEVLMQLNASVEASEEKENPPRSSRTAAADAAPPTRHSRREIEQLKQQVAASEKKQQETKATVMNLRSEFLRLVDMMAATGGGKASHADLLPHVLRDLDGSGKTAWLSQEPGAAASSPLQNLENMVPGIHATDTKPRHVSQPPTAPGTRARHNMGVGGSPRTYRSPGTYTTPRSGARPRGAVHQRTGHSAGASVRQRPGVSDMDQFQAVG